MCALKFCRCLTARCKLFCRCLKTFLPIFGSFCTNMKIFLPIFDFQASNGVRLGPALRRRKSFGFLGEKSKIFRGFFASRKISDSVVSSALAFARAGGRILRIRPLYRPIIFIGKISPKFSKNFFEIFCLRLKAF